HLVGTGPATTGGIIERDASLAVIRQIPWPSDVGDIFGLAVGATGDIYLYAGPNNFAPSANDWLLYVLSPAGTIKQRFVLPNSPPSGQLVELPSFDLAPDQCTVLYVGWQGVGRRFNACTGQQLPNLASPTIDAVRALSDGGYIA